MILKHCQFTCLVRLYVCLSTFLRTCLIMSSCPDVFPPSFGQSAIVCHITVVYQLHFLWLSVRLSLSALQRSKNNVLSTKIQKSTTDMTEHGVNAISNSHYLSPMLFLLLNCFHVVTKLVKNEKTEYRRSFLSWLKTFNL